MTLMVFTAPLILASASPRRVELLSTLGIAPSHIEPAAIDEQRLAHETPRAMAQRLACAKAQAVADRFPDSIVLGADTVVACGARVLPKARTDDDVRACLALLEGRRHRVFTGVCVIGPEDPATKTRPTQKRLSDNIVTFCRLSRAEIEDYVATKEGIGKAGGYAIQGHAAQHIRFISGSYAGIVGLPLFETGQMLKIFKKKDATP